MAHPSGNPAISTFWICESSANCPGSISLCDPDILGTVTQRTTTRHVTSNYLVHGTLAAPSAPSGDINEMSYVVLPNRFGKKPIQNFPDVSGYNITEGPSILRGRYSNPP